MEENKYTILLLWGEVHIIIILHADMGKASIKMNLET